MSGWAKTLYAAVQFASEAVEREWTSLEEWQGQSRVPSPLFAELEGCASTFFGQPLWALVGERRGALRQFARGVRGELIVLLSQLEPAHATAFLCVLPSARELGYSRERMMAALHVEAAQLQEWERQAVSRIGKLVSERTPFLRALAERCGSQDGAAEQVEGPREKEREALMLAARFQADFDLRVHVAPDLELAVRQALHREGLHERERVAEQIGDAWAVELVAERMMLELYGEEERREHGRD